MTIFRNGRKVITTPVGGDRQDAGDRAHDRHAATTSSEESYTGEIALDTPARRAGRDGGGRALLRSAPSATSRSRSAPARCSASTASWAAAASSWRARCSARSGRAARVRLDGRPLRSDAPRSARRAGIAFVPESRRSMLFHHEPLYKNTTISILERISRLWLKPGKEREIAREHVESLRHPDARASTRCSAISPAATSRRWRWPSG